MHLELIPSLWLVVAAPIYILSQRKQLTENTLHSKFIDAIKLTLSCVVMVTSIIISITLHHPQHTSLSPLSVVHILRSLILGIASACVVKLRSQGYKVSVVMTVFWWLESYSVVTRSYTTEMYRCSELLLYTDCAAVILSTILYTIPNSTTTPALSHHKQDVAFIDRGSTLSRLSWSWLCPLIWKGAQRDLTIADLGCLVEGHTTQAVLSRIIPVLKGKSKDSTLDAYHPSGSPGSLCDTGKPPLLYVICATFWQQIVLASLLKFACDIIAFSVPYLMMILVENSNTSALQSYKPYKYAAIFTLSVSLQPLLMSHVAYMSYITGNSVRTAVISMVYKKILTMSPESRSKSTSGHLFNLITVDSEHFVQTFRRFWGLTTAPITVIIGLWLIHSLLGPAVYVCLLLLLVAVPINYFAAESVGYYQNLQTKLKDSRIKLINEAISNIKVLKMYVWERVFQQKIEYVRCQEVQAQVRSNLCLGIFIVIGTCLPSVILVSMFAANVFVFHGGHLTPEKAFAATAIFSSLRISLVAIPSQISNIAKMKTSLQRLNDFLSLEDTEAQAPQSTSTNDEAIVVKDGNFRWDKNGPIILRRINMRVDNGQFVAIVGQVAAGKSSLISALLNQMYTVSGSVSLHGHIAYVPQVAWIQNLTLRDNIVFGGIWHEERYNHVISACSLGPDLQILPAGDLTEIGEKGVNLSGGQRQRVCLARAVYSDANIYLLDDPLSAVDADVGKHIFENVLSNRGLLKFKTRILVTHGIAWLPKLDQIIVMDSGQITETGSYAQMLYHEGSFSQLLRTYTVKDNTPSDMHTKTTSCNKNSHQNMEHISIMQEKNLQSSEKNSTEQRSLLQLNKEQLQEMSGTGISEICSNQELLLADKQQKLIQEEEVATGQVPWSVYKTYVNAVGYVTFTFLFITQLCFQASMILTAVYTSKWTGDAQLMNVSLPQNSPRRYELNVSYVKMIAGFIVLQVISMTMTTVCMAHGFASASTRLHSALLAATLRLPMSVYDTTPTARFINVFSGDMANIDDSIPTQWINVGLSMFGPITAVVQVSYCMPEFLICVPILASLIWLIKMLYVSSTRHMKRFIFKSRSPILSHFSETWSGTHVINAFSSQRRFIDQSARAIDHNQLFIYYHNTLSCWLDCFGPLPGCVAVMLGSMLSHRTSLTRGALALSLTSLVELCNLNYLVSGLANLEASMVAVERIIQYSRIPAEQGEGDKETIGLGWPYDGCIELRGFSTRYRPHLDLVLRDVNIVIRAREKIGVVGRTGSGKSSLTLALFHMITSSSGSIVIDGVDISTLTLHDLRTRLAILPQEPAIFALSVRENIDPLGTFTDAELWWALEQTHLDEFVKMEGGLGWMCKEGGLNLSVGQRQLLCLSRALLCRSKIFIMDEATSSVDVETDELIHDTIRQILADCTVLSIAHRITSVLDFDRILVLSEGTVAEFDTPKNLLSDPSSLFHHLATQASVKTR